jgi:hypothetical protein
MKYASLFFLCIHTCFAWSDSIPQPLKIHHVEPLFCDLVRDLGARKGERELNIGGSVGHSGSYVAHGGFAEFEYAPLNRLGIEIELPFSFYKTSGPIPAERLKDRIEGLKLATQYTFLVSGKHKTSLAAGYAHEFSMHSFETIRQKNRLFKGHIYHPFLAAAKQWTPQLHTTLITSAEWQHGAGMNLSARYSFNTSIHYVLPGPGHFIGMELNTRTDSRIFETMFRPQVKLILSPGIALGIVTGITAKLSQDHLSMMFRLIYEI